MDERRAGIENASDILDTGHARSVERRTVENVMEDSYLRYSMSVIIDRALPDVRDGMKPVHRRILYSMHQDGLRSSARHRKSANVVGAVMGKYHPHGDASIYDAMVRMAQPWSLRYTLVNGQGNFGSMDGDPPAAMRYTEAKMARLADELLADIDKETVDFRENYDNTTVEPSVLPAKLPSLLLNGQLGIAVGMATNIPPHNISELIDAEVHMIDNPDATLDDILQFVKGPDFPTGGVIYGKESIRTAYETGRGGVVTRGIANIEETSKGKQRIIISEIPYALNKETLLLKIVDLVREKKINGISDLRDETARGNVKIVIELKKDAFPKKILNQLYKLTQLQTSFHFNMMALIDGIQPRVLGLQEIISEHIKHRQIVVRRRTEFELGKAKDRAHVLEGLKIALDHIDEVIKTIRSANSTEEAQEKLIKGFKLSVIQAKAILAMQLRALTGLERKKVEDELAELQKIIAGLEAILADEKKIFKIIKEELLALKKQYGDERRTKVIPHELGKMSDEDLIPEEQVAVTLTSANYIKRSPIGDYKKQNRGGKGRRGMATREEDVIQHVVNASTHDYLLFFTNTGRVFRIKTYEVPAVGLNAKGVALINLLQLQPDETVSSVINLSKNTDAAHLFMCTKKGVVKKTAFDQYKNVRSSGLITINLDEGDELKWIRITNGDDDVLISTSLGQAMRFNESNVRAIGRTARGVRGIRLRPGDEVISMDVVREGASIFVISEFGYGKRTKVDQFTLHARGGVGIRSAVVNDKTGKLVASKSLETDDQEVILISIAGQTIRLGLKDIPELGRATQGVRIMRLNDNDQVASLALVDADEDSE
ncbi:DNA gyrase subunit A [Candidatus Saccharibacteria bacterium RIFCSPHIGHO2_12_FULL_41_12]|nr:MAG: DNA gyrase subunit A [Candidatus Saccharibacteria bacterium RIFCSPHIGHO2_12_FULL_41_12]